MTNMSKHFRVVPKGPDFYPTPAWATRALLDAVKFNGDITEPCCGLGHMSRALADADYRVTSSDMCDLGYGTVKDAMDVDQCDNIVTNPPYAIATELLPVFLKAATGKVALLLRMSFLESKRRYPMFAETPPSEVHVFSERLSMAPIGIDVKGGGTVAYGWFVWDANDKTKATQLKWIPPGYKVKGLY